MCVRQVINPHFCCYLCKNFDVRTVAVGMLVAGAFLSNIFLANFTFSIANMGAVVRVVSCLSYMSIFAFLLLKIVTWE